MEIRLKRVYEPAQPGDGVRILVERLWPRGVKKAGAGVDLWLKEVSPSPALRKWYGHDTQKWEEFKQRYRLELDENPQVLATFRQLPSGKPVTFVYAARDEQHNSALVLKEYLEDKLVD